MECVIEDSYKNMYDTVKNVPQAIKLADAAMKACGITPNHKPIRGGTDGAFLAEKGLACPNIFTGGYNFHSKHELSYPRRDGKSRRSDYKNSKL